MTRVELKERIDLTEKEQKMFDLLLDALRENNCDTRLRVADSFTSLCSFWEKTEDIDIAIDNMTGSRFLEKFQNYFSRKVGEKVNVHIIKSEPEKSKHLETGKMRLYDQWIDFEQLRKEEPDENSRIPTKVYFGTPEEDAYRRDLTINSLFYNIHTGLVEDLTGRGIDDLKSGRTTTPSPAKTIFLEVQDNIREMFLNEKPLMKGDKIIKEVQNGGQQNKSLTWNLTYPKGSVEECISWMANRDC
ncbi:hypothetical protein YC2023_057217 [Brassica napus]